MTIRFELSDKESSTISRVLVGTANWVSTGWISLEDDNVEQKTVELLGNLNDKLRKGKGALEISKEEAKTLFITVSSFCRIIDMNLEPKNKVELRMRNSFDDAERQHISDFLHMIDKELASYNI
jgi:hypothetical protein